MQAPPCVINPHPLIVMWAPCQLCAASCAVRINLVSLWQGASAWEVQNLVFSTPREASSLRRGRFVVEELLRKNLIYNQTEDKDLYKEERE